MFTSPLEKLNEYQLIREYIQKNSGAIQVNGCLDSGMVHFISAVSGGFKNRIIITFNAIKAREIYEDYKCFDSDAVLYPAKDFIFYNADIHGNLMMKERMQAIKSIIAKPNITIITTIDGLMDKVLPLNDMKANVITFKTGDIVDLEECKGQLTAMGYERVAQIDVPGQFAVRGSILDVFPITEEAPYRIDLWDEEVDIIKSFDLDTQRSIEQLDQIEIYPAAEFVIKKEAVSRGIEKINKDMKKYESILRKEFRTEEAHRIKTIINELTEKLSIGITGVSLDSYVNYFFENTVSLMDYFNEEETLFYLDEPRRIIEHGEAVEKEFSESMIHRLEKGYILPGQTDVLIGFKEVLAKLNSKKSILLTTLDQKMKEFEVGKNFHLQMKNVNPYNNSFELLVKDLKNYKKQGYKILVLAASKTRGARLASDLMEFELSAFYSDDKDRQIEPGEIMVTYGNLHKGFEYSFIKFVVITESDIFGFEKKKKRKGKTYSGQKIQSFTDLNVGDYVVHENHGLGIYRGIEKIEVDKVTKDYIKIEYAGNGNLYILATGLDMIQKYAGSDAKKPKLNKLGSVEWSKTKQHVKGAVKDIAKELVQLYAKRQEKQGFIYSQDTVWQKEFEEMFPYAETEDQLNAVIDIKKDMESTKITDRLICGDVGYGKTEVAIRAAFKAIQDGKQVAFLVPTTILAQQHYNTFTQRFKDYPVRVDLMCRFRTAAEQKHTLTDLKKGFVDIVIGTHRILSKDIVFKDLGLLIVDEEQRFGVTHKEKIKQLKENVDVITLTATPIPRTLHMSLIGIRDMSVLEEPPVDRMPIQTYVMEYNDEMVREAINRELARNGQVYYVYNRVNNIEEIALRVAKLVPDANVSYAHGQMSERRLEQIMYDFINGEIDVLVSTTIIETGMDISNANTMIVHDADKLGLSQLYQLRGRVGRSSRTSYAFLMYKRDKMLKEVAEKRLSAIKEFTELGAGFKIAMKDLEIRGAGNLLGAKQHGHMEAVGYDLYCKMLNEAVLSLKGIEVEEKFETTIDLNVDAYIPPSYIKNEMQKLDVYKRIASIEDEDEYLDMQDELLDRFGDIPKQAANLLKIALLKALANKAYITEISGNRREIRITMLKDAKVDAAKIPDLIHKYGKQLKFTVGAAPYFNYTLPEEIKDNEKYLNKIQSFLEDIFSLKENSKSEEN